MLKRQVKRQLDRINFDVPHAPHASHTPYTLKIVDSEAIDVSIIVPKGHNLDSGLKNLKRDFQFYTTFVFPVDYPFKPPLILLYYDTVAFLNHPYIIMLDDECSTINTCDFGPFMDINQLLWNLYLIVTEALEMKENEEHITFHNNSTIKSIKSALK